MTSTTARKSAAVAIAAGALVLAGGLTAPAMATTDTGGSLTITVNNAFAAQLLKSGVVVQPVSPATGAVNNSGVITATFPVTGGNADLNTLSGSLTLGGSLKFVDSKTHKCVTWTNLTLSFDTAQLIGQPSPTSAPVALADAGGNLSASINGTSQSFSADGLTVDAAGASSLDSTLNTSVFTAGQAAGALATTYTTG